MTKHNSHLSLELDKLGQRPLTIRYDFPAADLDAGDEEYLFNGPVTGDVTFTRVGHDMVATGSIQTIAQTACARCLDPVQLPLDARVDELWVKKLETGHRRDPDENEDFEPDLTHHLEGDRLELAGLFRELIVAELPDRVLCRADCKGLCTGCGANLNRELCRCGNTDGTPEPDGLPQWKNDLKNLSLN